MADRGFDMGDVLQHHGVNIPPILGEQSQLTSQEVCYRQS